MNLRNQLIPSSDNNGKDDLRQSEETITIFLWDHKSGVEVKAYHDTAFNFLRNMVDIFWDVAEKIDCERWEKLVLLNDWVDSIWTLRDKRFGEFNREDKKDNDDDDE